MEITPEGSAHINIDALLTACGWLVENRSGMNLYASRGVTVREFPPETWYSDYLLFVDQHAAGVIDVKAEDIPLAGKAEEALRKRQVMGSNPIGGSKLVNTICGGQHLYVIPHMVVHIRMLKKCQNDFD